MPATYEPIATTTLGSAASSIAFSSIPGTYTDLRIVVVCRQSTTANTGLNMSFNNDTSALYSITILRGDGSAASSVGFKDRAANVNVAFTDGMFNSNSTSGLFSLATIDILSYAGSTHKSCLVSGSNDKDGAGTTLSSVYLYRSTTALSSVQLFPDAGSFATNTTATLYGILRA